MNELTYIDVINFGIALVGATLGVLSFYQHWTQTRVKLRVRPKQSYMLPNGLVLSSTTGGTWKAEMDAKSVRARWAIEVVNLSAFPVSIAEIGFGSPVSKARSVIVAPDVSPGFESPVRLESRQSVTYYGAVGHLELPKSARDFPLAFVETDCGEVRVGSSPILLAAAWGSEARWLRRLRLARWRWAK